MVSSFFQSDQRRERKPVRNYKQLSQAQRYQIEILKKAGKKPKRGSGIAGYVASHDLPGVEGQC
jgi:hypothetical protein